MAIQHAVSGQLIDIRPLAGQLDEARSVALFKSGELEVMRLVVPAGKSFPPHWVKGEVTIQCLEGAVDLAADGQTRHMTAGQLVWLKGGLEHGLKATENASLLLTIVLRRDADGEATGGGQGARTARPA